MDMYYINSILIWIGNPKPHLQSLACRSFSFEKPTCFVSERCIFSKNHELDAHLMIMLSFENTKVTGNAIPCTKVAEFRLELSSRPDW